MRRRRYPSDLTDPQWVPIRWACGLGCRAGGSAISMSYGRGEVIGRQWALVSPHIPPAKARGRPRTTDMRAVFNAILYLLRTGCQWRQLPADFPPWPTVHGYFRRWHHWLLDRSAFCTVHSTHWPALQPAGTLDRRLSSWMANRSRRAKRGRSRLRWPQAGERTETPHSGRCARPSARQPR
jgi:transposase